MTSPKKKSRSSPSSRKPQRISGSARLGRPRREVALAAVKDDFSRYLRLAATEEIVITRHGKPAGVLIGFDSDEAWFEYRLEHHPEFLARVSEARRSIGSAAGVRFEDI